MSPGQQQPEPSDHEDLAQPEDLMAGFRPTADGVTARFAKPEAAIIRDLVGQVVELVVADIPAPDPDELAAMVGISDSTEVPDDPVLARLLPDGYRDDPEAAEEFRRFTESGLRSAKVESAQMLLQTLPASGGKVRLSSRPGRGVAAVPERRPARARRPARRDRRLRRSQRGRRTR